MGEFNDWNSFWNPQPTGNCMGLSKVSKRSCKNFHTICTCRLHAQAGAGHDKSEKRMIAQRCKRIPACEPSQFTHGCKLLIPMLVPLLPCSKHST